MRYYKTISDGYIIAIGTGGSGTEITEGEYGEIMSVIQSKPPRTATTDYHLREDLTWEEYERFDTDQSEEEIDAEEALRIITGGGA